MARRTFTVSEINKYVKGIIDSDILLSNILLKGEVSNLKKHYSNHMYFNLKDENSSINVVIFKSFLNNIPFEIENGQNIILLGSITLYEQTGNYQLIAENAEPVGKGAFQLAFEQLKDKLSKEGYFDKELKKDIPLYPKTIGIVTSSTGAVIHDFINIVTRRNKTVKIILAQSKVQGVGASKSIKEAIENLNSYGVDLIVVARGGGSIEDLWPYNDEVTIKAIYNSKIPVISAIGHETDFTLADFVADLRASTPSEAAELSVQKLYDLQLYLETKLNYLNNHLNNRINFERDNLYSNYKTIGKFEINESNKLIEKLNRLNFSIEKKLAYEQNKYSSFVDKLNLNNPINILNKGFSITEYKNKRLLSIKNVNTYDNIKVILKDGEIEANILKVREKNG